MEPAVPAGGMAAAAPAQAETVMQAGDSTVDADKALDACVIAFGKTIAAFVTEDGDLNLTGAVREPRQLRALSRVLMANAKVPGWTTGKMNLSGNEIGSEGGVALGDALKVNQTLQHLGLSGNEIGPEGVMALGDALKVNQTLQHLSLHDNKIHSIGTEFLSTRRLREFEFDWNLLVWPPPSRNPATVYRFLEAIASRAAPLTRSRIMFVGDGGDGKTTLKTALTMLANGANQEALSSFQARLVQHIKAKWTAADLREWVDSDLARLPGTFDEKCPTAAHLDGRAWLELDSASLEDMFGAAGKPVVDKMQAAVRFLKSTPNDTPPFDRSFTVSQLTAWAKDCGLPSASSAFCDEDIGGADLADILAEDDGGKATLRDIGVKVGHIKTIQRAAARVSEPPYAPLLAIPHVWTDAVELDTQWGDFTLWDFPGQMELYPAHRLFLAFDTAIYVVVLSGDRGDFTECACKLSRWLSLVRSGLRTGAAMVEVRIVVTHTDRCTVGERGDLLRCVHRFAVDTFGQAFHFGDACFATQYTEPGGGDVDALRSELCRLRTAKRHQPRPMAASYQDMCDEILTTARERPRWPVVRVCDVPRQSETLPPIDDALATLEMLGVVRRAGDQVVLEPVTWLSRLLGALLHPHHGIPRRPLVSDDPNDPIRAHLEAVRVDAADVRRALCNLHATVGPGAEAGSDVVEEGHEREILPLLATFDLCFTFDGLARGAYIFPALLPRIRAFPAWLGVFAEEPKRANPAIALRYLPQQAEDEIPPTLASLVARRLIDLCIRLGGNPVLLGCATTVVHVDGTYLGVHVDDRRRGIDVFAAGSDRDAWCSAATLHVVHVVQEHYSGLCLGKHRVIRATKRDERNPNVAKIDHIALGKCRLDSVTTTLAGPQAEAISPPWLNDEYEILLRGRDRSERPDVCALDDWLAHAPDPQLRGRSTPERPDVCALDDWLVRPSDPQLPILLHQPQRVVDEPPIEVVLPEPTAASVARCASPLVDEEEVNWIKASKLVFDVLSAGLRRLFRKRFRETLGMEWRDDPDYGRYLVHGGGPPGSFTVEHVAIGRATALAQGNADHIILVDVDLTKRLHKGELVCMFDSHGNLDFSRLAKDPTAPIHRPEKVVPGKLELPKSEQLNFPDAVNVCCGLRASTESGAGAPRICNLKGQPFSGNQLSTVARLREGNSEEWDPTALRMVLIGSRICGQGTPLITEGESSGILREIISGHRNDKLAHMAKCRLPKADLDDLVALMHKLNDVCLRDDAFVVEMDHILQTAWTRGDQELAMRVVDTERRLRDLERAALDGSPETGLPAPAPP